MDNLPVGRPVIFPANPVWNGPRGIGGLIIPVNPSGTERGAIVIERVSGFPISPALQAHSLRRFKDVSGASLKASVQVNADLGMVSGVVISESAAWDLSAWKETGERCRTLIANGTFGSVQSNLHLSERFSRTLLPGGEQALQSAQENLGTVLAVGFGRGNSQLVTALVQTLPARKVIVVDYDVHQDSDLNAHRALSSPGTPKAIAAAPLLEPYGPRVESIIARFEDPAAADCAKETDVMLVWPDEKGLIARRLSALAAVAYGVPALLIGTRIDEQGNAVARISFSVPMTGACGICLDPDLPMPYDPLPARTGSLLSVNLMAVSLALQMIQEWLEGSAPGLSQQFTARIRKEGVTIEQQEFAINPGCPICQSYGGGEDAWKRWIF